MLDREKLEAILARRFPGAAHSQIAAAANAIMGLGDHWEEVLSEVPHAGYDFSLECPGTCPLAREAERGTEFRLFRRRGT